MREPNVKSLNAGWQNMDIEEKRRDQYVCAYGKSLELEKRK